MLAEKQIVAEWLRQQGFFSIRPLYAKLARDLGFLALSYRHGLVERVWHVETISWVSVTPEPKALMKDVLKNRFDNAHVSQVVKAELDTIGLKDLQVEKVLIVGEFSQKSIAAELGEKHGITIISFAQVLAQVLEGLDTHYDRDPAIRSLQLFKFILAGEPEQLIDALFGERGIVSAPQRRRFARHLLESHMLDHELGQTDLEQLRPLLARKKATDPESLARLIEETLLNKKTRQPFIEALAKRKMAKPLLQRDMSLGAFFDDANQEQDLRKE